MNLGARAPELGEQVESCLEALKPRYAKATLTAYRAGLSRFQAYAAEVGVESAADLTDEVLLAFHAHLMGFALSESTVNLAIRSVKLFLKWGHGQSLCLWDGSSYHMKEPQSKAPEPPTVAVMQRLLELPNRQTPEGLRDLFCLELLYNLGLRRTEAVSLDLESLDLNEETLFVVGKNSDERLLPVGPTLKETALAYLFNGRPSLWPAPEEKALLLNDEGERLPPEALRYIVLKYGQMLDLKLSTHQLRHACATHLVEAGMELTDVQRLLGHRDLNSAKHYAQISQREMEREFHRVHPRSARRVQHRRD
ncbi:MAG: tyrosine-type recombinase/integrase [Vulcanimicrobiota bacterium]